MLYQEIIDRAAAMRADDLPANPPNPDLPVEAEQVTEDTGVVVPIPLRKLWLATTEFLERAREERDQHRLDDGQSKRERCEFCDRLEHRSTVLGSFFQIFWAQVQLETGLSNESELRISSGWKIVRVKDRPTRVILGRVLGKLFGPDLTIIRM